jgi:serine/threonine protein kinase
MKSPIDNQPQSDQHQFLQDSSLLTHMLTAPHSKEPQTVLPKADQKIVSLTKPVLAQLDSQGSIQINITVPASALILVKLLGEGAYGSVYEGLWNDQAVAIKQLKAQHLTEKTIDELRQEAQIMFQLGLESKYIVPLKKICLEAPHYSLVMELMPKGSLYHLLHNGQELPWAIRFQIALDASWGLKDLHAYSILHRDLKSLNILLDDRLRARLADFGLAKVKQEASSQSTIAKGTVLWMAPELFKRKAEATTAADIYSLGMVLWELVTREIPFKDAQNQLQAMSWIKDGEKEKIPSDCPPALKTIIESCWDLTPTKRPTAGQVVDKLRLLVTDEKEKLRIPTSIPMVEPPKTTVMASTKDEEMEKLRAEVMQMRIKETENERQRLRFEKMMEEHTRLKAELGQQEIKRQEVELEKNPLEPKLKKSALSLPTSLDIKKPVISEAVSLHLGILSSNPQTLMPAPKPLTEPMNAKALEQLLRSVAEGEQDKAEALIQKDNNLLLQAGNMMDLSGREFKNITAFQYALWAIDWHMWKMIQKYLPEEQQRTQFEELETKGTAHGKHFNFRPLIEALQTYVENIEKVWKYDRRARDHWCKAVGGMQVLVPAHVMNEYCRQDRSFDPCPAFTEEKLPRMSWSMTRYNGKMCGDSFAFGRAEAGGPVILHYADMLKWSLHFPPIDLKALQSLSKVRTQQLELLASQLKSSSYHLNLR